MNADQEEDLELINAVKNGDATAYRGLVEKYQGRIYGMVCGMVRDREDARDITQDAFVKGYNNLSACMDSRLGQKTDFYTWMCRIAMNLATDFIRKRMRQKAPSVEEIITTRGEERGPTDAHSEDNPRKLLERKRLYEKLADALEKLSVDEREAIMLREYKGLSYQEIAEIMQISEERVMSKVFYARKKLQKALAESPT